MVTASWDKTARVWDAVSGKPVGEPLKHEDVVYFSAVQSGWSAGGDRLTTRRRGCGMQPPANQLASL